MARTKYQRGSLKKIGNGQYVARWRRYVATPSGEKAIPRKKIVTKELAAKYRIGQDYPGPLTKSDVQRLLDILIAEDTGTGLVGQGKSVRQRQSSPPQNSSPSRYSVYPLCTRHFGADC